MAQVGVQPVHSWLDRRRFLELPWSLYRNHPHWIPPIRSAQPRLAGFRSHPFLATSEIQCFLAFRGRRPVGRVAAIVNHAHDQTYGERRGLPDYDPRIRAIDGRLFPCGFLRLLSRRGLSRFCLVSLTVAHEYQGWGLGLVLLRALLPRALTLGFSEAEFSWISETNTHALGGMRKAGLQRTKSYRRYAFGQAAIGPDADLHLHGISFDAGGATSPRFPKTPLQAPSAADSEPGHTLR